MSKAAKAEEDYYKAEIAKMFADMEVTDEHIRRTQAETAQIRTETRIILDRLLAEMSLPELSPPVETPSRN